MSSKSDLGFVIRNLSRQIKASVDSEIQKDYIDEITGTHGYILGFLCNNDGRDIYQKDIEHEFGIKRSTATKILQLMEKNQLLYRVSVSGDGRLKKIILTDKARKISGEIDRQIGHFEKAMVENFTQEEIDEMHRLIKKMQGNLQALCCEKEKNSK